MYADVAGHCGAVPEKIVDAVYQFSLHAYVQSEDDDKLNITIHMQMWRLRET